MDPESFMTGYKKSPGNELYLAAEELGDLVKKMCGLGYDFDIAVHDRYHADSVGRHSHLVVMYYPVEIDNEMVTSGVTSLGGSKLRFTPHDANSVRFIISLHGRLHKTIARLTVAGGEVTFRDLYGPE